jgi:hypothetical protein
MGKNPYNKWWKIIYFIYPPILRILEKLGFHKGRQLYLIGILDKNKISPKNFEEYLKDLGYEKAILAWKDDGEIFSLRKINNYNFQYHIRLFDNDEIRCHYEYSSEANPIKHVMETIFNPETEYFESILKQFLI